MIKKYFNFFNIILQQNINFINQMIKVFVLKVKQKNIRERKSA